jgi:hypothetical protein
MTRNGAGNRSSVGSLDINNELLVKAKAASAQERKSLRFTTTG